MALIKCSECGKEYSNLAAACPNCGCPTNVGDPIKQHTKPTVIPKKRVNPFVDVEDTGSTIIKKYKSLPSIPKVLTIIGMILIPVSTTYLISIIGTTSLANSLSGGIIFQGNFYTNGELAYIVIFTIWSFVSLLGIYRLKKWGLYSFFAYFVIKLLVLVVCSSAWKLCFSDILFKMMWSIIYVCTLMFEEAGHNAFAIVLNNGVIEEKK